VELIDGDDLCDLLKDFGLGVEVTQRVEEDISIVLDFFTEYDE
jgi:restriction system protein